MNNTQNDKIAQVTNETMVIGIDIGSEKHWARAFDNRGMELSKKAFGSARPLRDSPALKSGMKTNVVQLE